MVEMAVVLLVALVVAGGIVVWHEVTLGRDKWMRGDREQDLEGVLGQNDLQKSSTER